MPLYIDNELMPEPAYKGITFSDEKIWSASTGRSTSGRMNGNIVALKKTRNIKFPPLKQSELDKLNGIINQESPWHSIRYVDSCCNIIFEFECYFGTPNYNVYSGAQDLRYYTDYMIDAIER